MRDQAIWSISLGRWNGVLVRVHMFFFFFAAFTLYLGWQDETNTGTSTAATGAGLCLAVLLISVIIHELGHIVVANRLGGSVDEVVLGPLGGLGPAPGPLEPQNELAVVSAGPLANLGVCLTAAVGLALQRDLSLAGLLNPLAPADVLTGTPLIVGMKVTFWVNWLLITLNLIPAYPFDGGRGLRAGLMVLKPSLDHQHSVLFVARFAKVTAGALLLLAWFSRGINPTSPLQTWFALVLLAIFVFFSAKKEEALAAQPTSEEAFLGYDFSAGYTSLEQSGPRLSTKPSTGPLVRWWKRRQEIRDQRRREVESHEDVRVDEILVQLHEQGLDSLSHDDRELLKRVSARYRNRLQ